ncbi:hypothetical protein Micbo1qcDRAFT_174602 [Microdochium bolleyi]|uniref:Uncharacterized protein n=1 Tax=Microdochium bolleyi TaxID=196109 RepID=A0A136J8R7_9PEZI|nr:hypothetical protein Micbo1qcDRAFT_174602 [Microdochium bolleyi]
MTCKSMLVSLVQYSSSVPDEDCRKFLEAWRKIGRTLSHVRNLTCIDVWIDHSSMQKWASFNERAIVAPLVLFAKDRPEVTATVHLPWLHPLHEKQHRHFTESAVERVIRIKRFIRQRQFVQYVAVGDHGSYHVDELEDFPYLALGSAWWRFSTSSDLIEAERSLFRQGVDVETGRALFDEKIAFMGGRDGTFQPSCEKNEHEGPNGLSFELTLPAEQKPGYRENAYLVYTTIGGHHAQKESTPSESDMVESKILTLPWDLRHGIWSLIVPRVVHVSIEGERLVVSACGSSEVRCPHDYGTRKDFGPRWVFSFLDRPTGRWTPRWSCKEHQLHGLGPDTESLMTTCNSMLVRPKRVHLILEISREFVRAVEEGRETITITKSAQDDKTWEDHQCEQKRLDSWRRIGETLLQMSSLTCVDIWMDHSSPESWVALNERLIAQPLAAFAQERRENITATIHLPYLHPLKEVAQKHFIPSTNCDGLRVKRFARQRVFVRPHGPEDWYPHIKEVDDFPYLAKGSHYWRFSTSEELFQAERDLFLQGVDVPTAKVKFDNLMYEFERLDSQSPFPRWKTELFRESAIWEEFYRRYNTLEEEMEDHYLESEIWDMETERLKA